MKVFKIIAAVFGVILALLVVAAGLLVWLFDPNDYKDYVTQWVEDETGRSFTIADDLELSFFPWLAVETGGIALGNAAGFGDRPFAVVERVSARVRLMPLLQRQFQIGTVQLDGLELDLARDAEGRTNWDDLLTAGDTAEQPADAADGTDQAAFESLDIEAVALRGARIVWRDGSDAPTYIVNDMALQTGAINPSEPIAVQLALNVLDVASQMTAALDLRTNVALEDGNRVAADGIELDFGLSDAANNERANGVLRVAALSYSLSDQALSTGAGEVAGTMRNAPIGGDALEVGASWQELQFDPSTLGFSIRELATTAGDLRASWQVVGQELGSDTARLSGSVVVADNSAAALLALLGITPPAGLDARDLGNFDASTTFAVDLGTERIELTNTSATALGIDARADRVVATNDGIDARVDIAPFRPTAGVRRLIAGYLPEGVDVDAIGRLALSGTFVSNAEGAALSDLRAELLGGTFSGDVRMNGVGSGRFFSGRLAASEFAPNEIVAVLRGLIAENLDAQSVGTVSLATEFRYTEASSSLALNPLRLTAFGLNVQGEVSAPGLGTRNEYSGRARIDNFAPREVLTRFGLAVPQTSDESALRRASLDTNFEITPTRGAFDNLVVGLDDSRITGNFVVEDFADPRYRFTLNADKFDADRYLPPQAEEAEADERRAGDLELSNEALSAIRVDGNVRVGALRLAGMDFQNVTTAMIVGDGSMHLDGAHADLYGGAFDGRFHVDTGADLPTMLLNGKADGVQLAPLIVALLGEANFSGTANFDIDLQGRGMTVTDNLHSAAGTMGFALANGTIEGFNIDSTLCRAFNRARQQPVPADQPNRTPYEVVRGTARVTDGIAYSNDLFAQAGSAEVRGEGSLALADQIADYKFEARLARTVPIPGCQDMERIVGLDFPLVMKGPVASPEITADYGEVLKRIVEDRVRDNIQERIQDRLLDRILR